ncbi:hypothetical protein FRB91_008788 [Serendipita sp. 411]|nr:hypothetical protein FRB91_008788 [Serendipita sp. 411]
MDRLSSYLSNCDPVLHIPIYFTLFNITWTYVVGELTGNCSQVDRMWTFFPTMYTAYYALLPSLPFAPKDIQEAGLNYRVCLMLALQVFWMTRLSYNTWRRGLFAFKDEDYRWQISRDSMPVSLFHVFHFVFIAAMQNAILFGLGYPAYLALRNPNAPLGIYDALLVALSIIDVLVEFAADNQQYSYQTFKHSKRPRVQKPEKEEWFWAKQRWSEDDAERGFIVRGLWAWSRHPNFAAEQTFWWLMTLFPILTGPGSLDPPSIQTILSPETYQSIASLLSAYGSLQPLLPGIIISFLFLGSTRFTEWITKKKYPVRYKAYQRRVGMFSPIGTVFKGWYLQATGERKKVDDLLWGPVKALNGTKKAN